MFFLKPPKPWVVFIDLLDVRRLFKVLAKTRVKTELRHVENRDCTSDRATQSGNSHHC